MTFGTRLKILRTEQQLTQSELAGKVKLSKANISKYESDSLEPNIETLKEFSQLFNVTVDYLLGHSEIRGEAPVTKDDLMVALFGGKDDVTPEMWDEVKRFAEFVKQKNDKK